jgi:hypothetical protein
VRGGAYNFSASNARVAARGLAHDPTRGLAATNSAGFVGFRLVRTVT